MGFWVLLMVLYALALALGAGVAFGYDYYLVQHTDRASTKSNVKLGEYLPKMLKQRSAGLSDADVTFEDDEITTEASKPLLQLVAYMPNWLYKGTPKQSDLHTKPSRITETLSSISSTIHATRRKVLKKPKPSKKNVYSNKKIKSKKTSTITKKILKLSTVSLTPIPRRTKVVLRTSTSFQANTTKNQRTSERSTSPWDQNVIRIFVPKAPFFKWRSTRPEKYKFFYRTPANYVKKKTKEVSYQPEMQMRKPVSSYGKRKGLPMRHWPVPTKATEPYTTIEENHRNVLYF